MPDERLELLARQAEEKGQRTVARELGYSPATVSQVLAGKYRGQTENVLDATAKMYGGGGLIQCPELGAITPTECAETREKADAFGRRATGNPSTYRLYAKCRQCSLRR